VQIVKQGGDDSNALQQYWSIRSTTRITPD